MDHSVLSEQDNLARGADEPLPTILRARSTSFAERELLHGATNGVWNTDIVVRGEGNRSSLCKRMAEIVQQIRGVFDANAEADQILGKSASSPGSGVDRGVPGISSRQRQRVLDQTIGGWDLNLNDTHDITQGMLIKLFTQPKLTLMPQRRVAATMRSLNSLSPVSKESTAP